MKKLKALLVGINNYTNYPLVGCVNDVQHVEKYIQEHITNRFGEKQVSVLSLLNEQATKARIIHEIITLSENVTKDTTLLLYFSGHGTREETGGLFKEEYNGLLECFVCYEENEAHNLLSDKEIRYLLNEIKGNPHLVTIFDCCHAGTLTKAPAEDNSIKTRSIYGRNPPRAYKDFWFSQKIEEAALRDKYTYENFGAIKNHIHIGACLQTEKSIEMRLPSPFDEQQYISQGILTNYLVNFLIATNSNINYEELARWAHISFKDATSSKQTPTIKVHGTGDLTKLSGWLGVANLSERTMHMMKVYPHHGNWYVDKGTLWGLQTGMKIAILDDNTVSSQNVH